VHHLDLLLLRDNDFLCETTESGILSCREVGLRHVDGALMVRDHHGGEVVVGLAGHRRRCHVSVHFRHRIHHGGRDSRDGVGPTR
jgi:hypothetical protein